MITQFNKGVYNTFQKRNQKGHPGNIYQNNPTELERIFSMHSQLNGIDLFRTQHPAGRNLEGLFQTLQSRGNYGGIVKLCNHTIMNWLANTINEAWSIILQSHANPAD